MVVYFDDRSNVDVASVILRKWLFVLDQWQRVTQV